MARPLRELLGSQQTRTHNHGSKRIRCPKCGDVIWVPRYLKDYVHKDCFTKDMLDMDKFTSNTWWLNGMRDKWPQSRSSKDQTKTKNKSRDFTINLQ